jgi:NAD-specific glutamate dehydrogenase
VEFGLNGGGSNTDFIDNAGGVDCSDHEVNIKILLNEVVQAGDMTDKQRNQLLASMTDEVGSLVLGNNYKQTQALSLAARVPTSACRVQAPDERPGKPWQAGPRHRVPADRRAAQRARAPPARA